MKNHFGEYQEIERFSLKYNERSIFVKVTTIHGCTEIWNFERFLYYNPQINWEDLNG